MNPFTEVPGISWSDRGHLAACMRTADIAECADSGLTPTRALRLGEQTPVWTLRRADGEPLGVWGVVPDTGVVWSLWSDLTPSVSRYIFQRTPGWIKTLSEMTDWVLHNYVPADHHEARMWIERVAKFKYAPIFDTKKNGNDYLYFYHDDPDSKERCLTCVTQ